VTESRKSLSDEALRRLYADTESSSDHPSEDTLAGLLAHGTSSDERERVVDHVSRCGECADVLRHLARCVECPPETGVKPLGTRGQPTRSWRLWGGLAAAAAVATFLVWPPGPDGTPGTPDPEVLRAGASAGLAPESPVGPQKGSPTEIRWRAVPEALTYRVVVRDARGEPVFVSPALSEASCPWPAERTLAPGAYTWQVLARTRNGEETASALVHFSLP
jgi:hypothetical protein